MNGMLVAMVPLNIVEASPEENLRKVGEYACQLHEGVSIMVLPELFSTGFVSDEALLNGLAEPIDGKTMGMLKEVSSRQSLAIAGSFLCRDETDGTLRNRAFFINPDDNCNVAFYDKRHLFPLSFEHKVFTGGNKLSPIVKFRDWNIALSVCFDIRFPVWMRNTGNRYDMMIVPANWPDSRFNAWSGLLTARAIENIASFVGTNCAGTDRFGTYSYLSTIALDHRGNVVSEFHGNTPVRYATFDLKTLRDFRETFPVYKVSDNFTINLDNRQ